MADSTVHIGENSPEQVAYKLLDLVMSAEKRTHQPHMANRDGNTLADRKYILDTYAECLLAVTKAWKRAPEE